MTSRETTAASPEILFDVPSTSSPELSFSTPRAEPSDVHEDLKTSGQNVDVVINRAEHDHNGDSTLEYADKPSLKELEGMRTVNLTPTSPTSEGKLDGDGDPNSKRTSSPPIVLKSAPGTPTKEQDNEADDAPIQRSASGRDSITTKSLNGINGLSGPLNTVEEDLDDPRELVISSLRTQISDLFSQVNLLNSKLVQSYDRVSTLEETLDDNTERLRALEGERMNLEREKSVLELETAKHDQMLKDGQLVERSAVAAELSRLMEESLASSNAKHSAEAKHKQMESELSDLSANLFSTANEMVATERQQRASAEQSLIEAKASSALLEEQLETMRLQLGGVEKQKEFLQEATARTEQEVYELRKALKGVNSSNVTSQGTGGILRMMNSHAPYKNEYLGFLAHLRSLVASTPNTPAITSLLTLPFLARLAVEDSEPTLRLDLAPSLNWLTRRSVLAAIHSNTLLIEQIHVATLFLEGSAANYSYAGFGSGSSLPTSPTQLTKVNCALCGKVVYMSPEAIQAEHDQVHGVIISQSPITPTPNSFQTVAPSPQRSISGSGWGASKFLKGVTLPSLGGVVAGAGGGGSRSNSPAPRHTIDSLPGSTPTAMAPIPFERPSSPPPPTSLQTVIHAFRVPITGKSGNNSTTNLMDPSQPSENYGPPYPLCHTGWCVSRLKTTLDLWGCVKTEVVERVWRDGEIERQRFGSGSGLDPTFEVKGAVPILPTEGSLSTTLEHGTSPIGSDQPPPVPPKRKMPNLWGMGKDVLDKAKAYGNGSPGSDGVTTTPTASSTGASSFFGGVRRTFSGSAVATNTTTPAASVADVVVDDTSNDNGMGTIKGSHVPSRSAGRLSAVFTNAAQITGATPIDSTKVTDSNKLEEPLRTSTENTASGLPLASSTSLDAFVTPSETPLQVTSPNPNDDAGTGGANPESLSSAIENHLASTVQESAPIAVLEPPTPTPNSTGFTPVGVATSGKHTHVRNTSIASIISEGNTATPRPSTPVTPSGSESKIPTKSGSRPSTPGKTGAPPPVPRRAAARNAARTSMVIVPEAQKAEGDGLGGVGESAGKETMIEAPAKEGQIVTIVTREEQETESSAAETTAASQEVPTESNLSIQPPAPSLSTTSALPKDSINLTSTPIDAPSAISSPKSLSAPLPVVEPPSPISPSVPPSLVDGNEGPAFISNTRPRQASVVSSSSVYSPSVYTTNSGVNLPGLPGGDADHSKGGHVDESVKFYVGRESWEERAWIQLVEIRESMFWARLGGVRY